MIDYIKLQIFVDQEDLLSTLKRAGYKVTGQHDVDTGQIYEYPITAINGNLKIEIKSAYFIQLSGSIHKFAHSGVNYTDFYLNELFQTIFELIKVLELNPYTTAIHNIEFGVNINPPFATNKFLKQVINYGGKGFSPMPSRDGNSLGIECQFAHFRLKMYCKKTQYKLPDETMRFEIHVEKMQYLNEKKIRCKYLSDLFDVNNLIAMGNLLKTVFSEIIIIDNTIDTNKLTSSEAKVMNTWSHPIQLQQLHERDKKIFQYQRRQFREIQKKYSTANKQQIATGLIADKINQLLTVDDKTSTILTNFDILYPIAVFNQSYQLSEAGKIPDFNQSYHSDKQSDSLINSNQFNVVKPLKYKQQKLPLTFPKPKTKKKKNQEIILQTVKKIIRRKTEIAIQLTIPFPYESMAAR